MATNIHLIQNGQHLPLTIGTNQLANILKKNLIIKNTYLQILDLENNKVILELITHIQEMNSNQYSYVDINFNFEQEELVSYTFYSYIDVMSNAVGMSLTADGEYLYKLATLNEIMSN